VLRTDLDAVAGLLKTAPSAANFDAGRCSGGGEGGFHRQLGLGTNSVLAGLSYKTAYMYTPGRPLERRVAGVSPGRPRVVGACLCRVFWPIAWRHAAAAPSKPTQNPQMPPVVCRAVLMPKGGGGREKK
jgi:hypothetical protein